MSKNRVQAPEKAVGFWGRYVFWGYRQWWVRCVILLCWLIILVPTLFLLGGFIGYVLYDAGLYDPGMIEKRVETDTEICIEYYDRDTQALRHKSCDAK